MNIPVNIYCDESTHLPSDGHPFMVQGAIVCPLSESDGAHRRLIEIRQRHGLTGDFEIKWNKISPAKLSFYLDVVDYFFDDDDLGFRAVVSRKKGLDHASFDQTHDDWYYKMLFYLIRNVLPASSEAYIYLDKKDTKGGSKVDRLHQVIANARFDFDRQKIRRLQIVESHHVGLMQLADVLIGAVNYANRGLSGNVAKEEIVQRVRDRAGITLTQTTLLSATKFNLFKWTPRGEEL
ncbi:DUF3800 domain-containing protein [Flaviflexus ciconiae]|uniref:DUF3800 domain-containing protein n=1 Tax=Flaviflexus ciconiae TaxID=2496867 RepID=A0A3Q9G7W8_9ACTO|nr:DUF3800 domain-containing protein [Flaviflexus ciconiae]AZQ77687.1 DUF3800 domain-containing protein [Flaviflexus ciconiae]